MFLLATLAKTKVSSPTLRLNPRSCVPPPSRSPVRAMASQRSRRSHATAVIVAGGPGGEEAAVDLHALLRGSGSGTAGGAPQAVADHSATLGVDNDDVD